MEGRPKGFSGADRDPEIETSDIGSLDDEAFRTVDGAQSDEPVDPAFQAVIEAGGDAGQPEEDEDRGIYGEADEERSSERED